MLVEVYYILLCGHSIVTVRGVSFPGKSVSKVYGSTLLPLRGGGWGYHFQEKKHYVTLEWPQCHGFNYSNTDESITFELRDSCEVWVAMYVDLGVDGCV